MNNNIIIGRTTPRWTRFMPISLTVIILAAVIWLSNADIHIARLFMAPQTHPELAARASHSMVESDIITNHFAETIERSIYMPYGEFTGERLLAAAAETDNAETVEVASLGDISQEFYLPYGNFTEERLYGSAPEQERAEVVAENTLPFVTMPAQCGLGAHSGCAVALDDSKELL